MLDAAYWSDVDLDHLVISDTIVEGSHKAVTFTPDILVLSVPVGEKFTVPLSLSCSQVRPDEDVLELICFEKFFGALDRLRTSVTGVFIMNMQDAEVLF